MDQTRTLGKTKLKVKRIGFGANAVGGHNLFPNLNDETGKDLVRTALDGGVNFIDTAFIYGLGRSEELIGEVVQERGVRNELIISTKGAHKEVDGSIELDNSREFLRSEVEKSLKRLKTDYIDLYYVHFPDGKTPLAEVAGTLKELKDEGKSKQSALRTSIISNCRILMLMAIWRSSRPNILSYSVMPRKSFFHTVKNKASPLFLTFRLRPDC